MGGSQADAAAAAGVAHTTVQRWLKIPEFRAAVDEARAEIAELTNGDTLPDDWRQQASEELCRAAWNGVRTIRRAADGDAVPKVALDAAKYAIDRVGIEPPAPDGERLPTVAEALAEIDLWVLEREVAKRRAK